MNYYFADPHLGHENIIKLSKRPFKNVEEMDEAIIENWNSVVKDDDNVYIVGDFCFKSGKNPVEYLKRLNGRKYLVIGNHDGSILKNPVARRMFVEIKERMEVNDNGRRIILDHFPLVEWNGFFRGSLHFYGHIHNNVENATYKIVKDIPNSYNVGADILGFTPRTAEQVIKMNKEFNESH